MNLSRTLILLFATSALAGCVSLDWPSPFHDTNYPEDEALSVDHRELTTREKLLAKSDFSVEVVRLNDLRTPRSEMHDPRDSVIYEYEPDQLLGGIGYRLPVLFNKYLDYRPRTAKNYGVELEVTRLKTQITYGNFFYGQFGRYAVDMTVHAVARRPDSTVALDHVFHIYTDRRRVSGDGYSPTAELDRSREYDLTEDAVRQLSEQIAWQIRILDSRRWRVETPAPRAPIDLHQTAPQTYQGSYGHAPIDAEHPEALTPLSHVKQPTIPASDDDNTPPVFIEPEQNAQ